MIRILSGEIERHLGLDVRCAFVLEGDKGGRGCYDLKRLFGGNGGFPCGNFFRRAHYYGSYYYMVQTTAERGVQLVFPLESSSGNKQEDRNGDDDHDHG